MSNHVNIQKTIFQNIDDDGDVTDESYGIRVYDTYGQTYDNLVESKEALINLTDDELLQMAKNLNDETRTMFQNAEDNEDTIFINNRNI